MPDPRPARPRAGRCRVGYWVVAGPLWAVLSAAVVGLHLAGVVRRIDAEGFAVVMAAFFGAVRFATLMLRS